MSSSSTQYSNKLILAPMVRAGTLPLRLLALEYGADIVYCEELIDWKLLRSRRRENALLGTIDYVDDTDGTIIFRTCSKERGRVIMQIGTCDSERALKVAKLVEQDVAGIDVNMGCPKEFSIKGGMGAALLTQPEKVKNIITTLVKDCKVPVTAKIRLLPTVDDTIALCQLLQSCGVAAVAIHGRTREQRPHHSNNNMIIAAIARQLNVPVIANGGSKEIESYEDIFKFRNMCESSSVMIARAAQWNASVFRKEGMLPLDDVIKAYLRLAIEYDSAPANAKYCVQSMLRELQETPRGKKFLAAQSLQDICNLWDLGDLCHKKYEERRNAAFGHPSYYIIPATVEAERQAKRRKLQDFNISFENVFSLPCVFRRGLYKNNDINLPKTRLLMWTRSRKITQPSYTTSQADKLFCAIVTVDGERYTSSYWEKNKRCAEQGAALVCLIALGLESKEKAIMDESLLISNHIQE